MELRHLRYFVAVAESLNFRRAAARLHIASPPLSVQIRNLEAEIGAQLLTRERHGVRLTGAGKTFLQYAQDTLALARRGVAAAQQAAKGEIGHLSIGYNAPAEFRIFPQVIPAFKRKWGAVHLDFHRLETGQIIEGLRRDELDVGVVSLPVPAVEFDVQELTRQLSVAMVPADHRLAQAPSVSIEDLSSEPLILFARALDPETYHQIEQLFLRAGAAMNVVYELDTSLSMINFVSMGLGCSFLPDYAQRIRVEGVIYKPLLPQHIAKTLAIVKKKGRGELAETFYQFTIARLSEHDGS